MGDQEESEDSMTMRILNPGLDHRKGREAGLEREVRTSKRGMGLGCHRTPGFASYEASFPPLLHPVKYLISVCKWSGDHLGGLLQLAIHWF